ncbi:MAG: sigma-54-dependent transcriptional regulator [Byssovorax sp.]
MSGRILFIEDDRILRDTLELALRNRGCSVKSTGRAQEALDVLQHEEFDVILTDLKMPDMDGIELCQRALEIHREVPVIVLTAFGSFESAVAAIRAGAYDFLSKPVKIDALVIAINRAVHYRALTKEVRRLRLEVGPGGARIEELFARSPSMDSVQDLILRASASASTILVTGESGTGKEVVARVIHKKSGRSGPFVAVNCAAMPETLLESELFGHSRGAFTDAKDARPGLFTEANGGTLLLDEIGDMPLGLQPKLLRVLQERRVRPVGGRSEHAVDVRIIAATNRDLETAVEEGRFREDLFFRINVVHIELPPLRSRTADILPLAQHFLEQLAPRVAKDARALTPAAAQKLLSYSWPGNVRELQNCIERAVTLTRFDHVGVEDLPEKIRNHRTSHVLVIADDPTELVTLEEVERRYILRVLESVGGNKTAAARILGIERKTLYRKLENLGVMKKS